MFEDQYARFREICLAFPEAVENFANDTYRTFLVRNKIFAYFMSNHHGDGRVALWCKARPGVQELLVASDPERYFSPPYVGSRGWIGARFDVGEVDWDEITDLIEQSYRMIAPKRVSALLDQVVDLHMGS